jgi:hypothetical protein
MIYVFPNKGTGVPGTKGLYLNLLEDGKVRQVALTYRHIIFLADLCSPIAEYRDGMNN